MPASGSRSESIAERQYCPCRPRRERYERTSAFSSVLGPRPRSRAASTSVLPSVLLPKTLLIFSTRKGTSMAPRARESGQRPKQRDHRSDGLSPAATIDRSARARRRDWLRRIKDVLPSSFRVAPFTSREYPDNLARPRDTVQGKRDIFSVVSQRLVVSHFEETSALSSLGRSAVAASRIDAARRFRSRGRCFGIAPSSHEGPTSHRPKSDRGLLWNDIIYEHRSE